MPTQPSVRADSCDSAETPCVLSGMLPHSRRRRQRTVQTLELAAEQAELRNSAALSAREGEAAFAELQKQLGAVRVDIARLSQHLHVLEPEQETGSAEQVLTVDRLAASSGRTRRTTVQDRARSLRPPYRTTYHFAHKRSCRRDAWHCARSKELPPPQSSVQASL